MTTSSFYTYITMVSGEYYLSTIIVIYKIVKSIKKKKQLTHTAAPQSNRPVNFAVTTANSTKKKDPPAKWYGPDASVTIKQYTINHAMVYAGKNLPDSHNYDNDASLIDPDLSIVDAEPWQGADEMSYWPKYAYISAKCRGAYLKWLSGGRKATEAYIGYVFLFFYGLERRLLIDGQKSGISTDERAAITAEIKRLLTIYGDNNSFRGYAKNLLATEWLLYRNNESLPDDIDFDYYCSGPFQVLLAQHVVANKPIPANMAMQWLSLHPDFSLRTPARRCVKEFAALFHNRYNAKFNEGIVVKPNKTKLSLEYRAASPSIRGMSLDFGMLPNPFILSAPLKKVNELAEQCCEALDPYSRYLGRKGDPDSLAALALLPQELMSQNAKAMEVKDAFKRICKAGAALMPTENVFSYFGMQPPEQISKKDAESIAQLLSSIGYGMAPDVRYHGAKPELGSSVVIFPYGHRLDFVASEEFKLALAIIRLGALVSQSDGSVDKTEELVLRNFIMDNRYLTGIEKDSLLAFLVWCLHTKQNTSGLKQKLSQAGELEKTTISRILLLIAHADDYIDPNEIKQLEKLYTMLSLDKSKVANDLHSMATEPVIVATREQKPGYTIPLPEKTIGLKLNEELIRIREQETQQVKTVLENIFTEDEQPIQEIMKDDAISTSPLTELDSEYQELFIKLHTKETWEREELHSICKDMGLMLDGAMEVLNEWSYSHANAPLVEDGDPIYVDIELAKEITDA